VIYFSNQTSEDHSIELSRDNLDGAGEGDDEKVTFNLPAVSPDIRDMFCVVTVYNEPFTFAQAANAFIRITASDGQGEKEVLRSPLGNLGTETAFIFAKISRSGNVWNVERIGRTAKGRKGADVIEFLRNNFLDPAPSRPLYGGNTPPSLKKRKDSTAIPVNVEIQCFLCGDEFNSASLNGEALLTGSQPIFLCCHKCYELVVHHKKNFVQVFRPLPDIPD